MGSKRSFLSLVYHDIFEYPLTDEELARWRMAYGKEHEIKIEKTGEFYHLKGRAPIIKLREKRGKLAKPKLKLAKQISTKLSTISSINFIGVTGSLAMNNTKKESDIDLMIITSTGTMWTTRIIVRIVSLFYGFNVRSAGTGESKNAVCFNLWQDASHLEIPRKMRNLYTAHEVLQVVPLYNRAYTFEKFLKVNEWAHSYWPMARSNEGRVKSDESKSLLLTTFYVLLAAILEPIAYRFQLLYMHRHRTRELVEPGRAFFHPIDWSKIISNEFEKRIKKYSLPLDKLHASSIK